MSEKIEDLEKIGKMLTRLKSKSNDGKYADVHDVYFLPDENQLNIVIEMPNENQITHEIEVKEFWQDASTLQNVLSWLDVDTEDFEELENRRVPVTRSNGKYEVDTEALQNGDYKTKD